MIVPVQDAEFVSSHSIAHADTPDTAAKGTPDPWHLYLQPDRLAPDRQSTQLAQIHATPDDMLTFAYRTSEQSPLRLDPEQNAPALKFLVHILVALQIEGMIQETRGHGDSALSMIVCLISIGTHVRFFCQKYPSTG
jgi:hypothetical protein